MGFGVFCVMLLLRSHLGEEFLLNLWNFGWIVKKLW